MTENNEMKMISSEELEQVTGGAGSTTEKKAQIINCKDAVNIRDANNHDVILGVIPVGAKCTFYGYVGTGRSRWGLVKYQNITGHIYYDYFKVLP